MQLRTDATESWWLDLVLNLHDRDIEMPQMKMFWDRLNQGPAILLIGQNYLRVGGKRDPLLYEIQRKYGGTATTTGSYDILIDGNANQDIGSALSWMSERCRRIMVPDWLKTLSCYPWSGIYSTAIDNLWEQTFRNEWRSTASILEENYIPRDPRNRTNLHCTYLFGAINRTDLNERPPFTKLEFLNRKATALTMSLRLKEVITPLGVLAIDGYDGLNDWFKWDDFYPVLHQMGREQIHLFNAHDELIGNPIIGDLVGNGQIVLHSEGLAEVLQLGIDQGMVRKELPTDGEIGGHAIMISGNNFQVPRDIWNRARNSAIVMETRLLTQPPPLSEEAHYWAFRNFLFESANHPVWSGYSRGFGFRRHFEKELYEKTRLNLEGSDLTDRPIVVHGQTGTGKTVALGYLALEFAKSGNYPVLFIERAVQRPVFLDIDLFCQWAENKGAGACLLIWDGMQIDLYDDLLGYLASRGRKVVLVGSSYKLHTVDDMYVPVPDSLTPDEAQV